MPFPKTILNSYLYNLPDEKIAYEPKEKRDHSKLLAYANKEIKEYSFNQLTGLLKSSDSLFFNNSKVIPARIHFVKETGAVIEIFLLEPENKEYTSLYSKGKSTWKCLIGNKKRWKEGDLKLSLTNSTLKVRWVNRDENLIEFSWEGDCYFTNILNEAGKIPLPPYIKRDSREEDNDNYQTVYAKQEGSVAAPTAGLHFTPELIKEIEAKGIDKQEVTLYVGAGTFKPVTVHDASDHDMHTEKFSVTKKALLSLLNKKGRTVGVGTTSVRVLESLYWMGIKLLNENNNPFFINKEDAYRLKEIEVKKSLNAILEYMENKELDCLSGETGIFIVPGYNFKMVDVLITNFHQPGSTLIMLVAAFIGEDWKKVYDFALHNNYRFLSYGDSSILERF